MILPDGHGLEALRESGASLFSVDDPLEGVRVCGSLCGQSLRDAVVVGSPASLCIGLVELLHVLFYNGFGSGWRRVIRHISAGNVRPRAGVASPLLIRGQQPVF